MINEAPRIIGLTYRALREAQGLSINDVMRRTGLERANLSRFERGVPGGINQALYMHTLARTIGLRMSVVYFVAEKVLEDESLLDYPDQLMLLAKKASKALNRIKVV